MSRLYTKTGHIAIVQVSNGGDIIADSNGEFKPGFPFSIKNDGADAVLVVRLAAQAPGETYTLNLWEKRPFSDELVIEILSGIPAGNDLKWGV